MNLAKHVAFDFFRSSFVLGSALLFTQATVASAAETVVLTKLHEGSGETIYSFYDSAFDYDQVNPNFNTKSYCYRGDEKAVCGLVQSAVDAIMDDYQDGDHDGIILQSCTLTDGSDIVDISYNLFDDYSSDFNVKRQISVCGKDIYPSGRVAHELEDGTLGILEEGE